MQTECTSRETFEFGTSGRRQVVARFDGGDITSDAGVLLLREIESKLGLFSRVAACFEDHRNPTLIEHSVRELVGQRILGLALGYEDLVDHDDLRLDPMLAVAVGKVDVKGEHRRVARDRGKPLAGKSTLNRLELTKASATKSERYKKIALDGAALDDLFVDLFVESFDEPPTWIEIDLDATDDPVHGRQEGRFFHGYYGNYCYLPLYVFCGEQLLCARLRTSNKDAATGSVEEISRIVARIRERFPKVEILVRGDSGFCREDLMAWCEEAGVWYLLGFARNDRLVAMVEEGLVEAERLSREREAAARVYSELEYTTRENWSATRRVVAKCEHLVGDKTNPRFVVTDIPVDVLDAEHLYEKAYCARGDMENRIKEQQLYLFADRTSAATMRANQIRLYMSSLAYVLLSALRRLGLKGTDLERAVPHDPVQVAQDRSARARERAACLRLDEQRVPLRGGLRGGPRQSVRDVAARRLRHRASPPQIASYRSAEAPDSARRSPRETGRRRDDGTIDRRDPRRLGEIGDKRPPSAPDPGARVRW